VKESGGRWGEREIECMCKCVRERVFVRVRV